MTITAMPNRDQLQLLREARVMIKNEFGDVLSLSAQDVYSQVYRYSIRSEQEALFKLYRKLVASGEVMENASEKSKQAKLVSSKHSRTYRGATFA